mmetsp:Transcript_22685/g.61890  ORF Transcript_22685/g.61890 Transcript_22685/m.61890 type:complete len:567 (-) Transcript_22685:144-1844(-)
MQFLSLALAAAGLLPCVVDASAFLGKGDAVSLQPRGDILATLEEELGSGHGLTDEARVLTLQRELSHTFDSLPKNRRGNLQAAGARYALHRLFVQRHAWQLVGLAPGGQGWANSSAADALGDRVPAGVRALLEERLAEEGVGLRELAVLAALLESMVHAEADDRLRIALRALDRGEAEVLGEDAATAVLHAYMASYVLGVPLAQLSPEAARKHLQSVEEVYPTWPDTQAFLNEVRDSVASGAARYDFRLLSDVLARVGDQYGLWQSKECSVLKSTLVGMESRPGSGRVRLGDFYRGALGGENWQFSESVEYLRQLGALDDSAPGEPSVIIPNYIGSPTNCVASSGYYAVCCVSECEALMDQLERQLRAPTASAEEVLRAVSALPGGAAGNGTLPAALLRRLKDVAAHHGGAVPLHGRLLAQWLHYAYPRECPFPHVSGTTNPLSAEEFEAQTGLPVVASEDEMRQFAADPRRRAAEDPEDGLCSNLWTMEEELVDAAAHAAQAEAARVRGAPTPVLQALALCLAAASTALALAKTVAPAIAAGVGQDPAAKWPTMAAVAPGATYSL